MTEMTELSPQGSEVAVPSSQLLVAADGQASKKTELASSPASHALEDCRTQTGEPVIKTVGQILKTALVKLNSDSDRPPTEGYQMAERVKSALRHVTDKNSGRFIYFSNLVPFIRKMVWKVALHIEDMPARVVVPTLEPDFNTHHVFNRKYLDMQGPFVLVISPLFRACKESRAVAMNDPRLRFRANPSPPMPGAQEQGLIIRAHDLVLLPREGWSPNLETGPDRARHETDIFLMRDIRGDHRVVHTATVMKTDLGVADKYKTLLSKFFSMVDSNDSCVAFAMCEPGREPGSFGRPNNGEFCELLPSGDGVMLKRREKGRLIQEMKARDEAALDESALNPGEDKVVSDDVEWEVVLGEGGEPVKWFLNDITWAPIFQNAQQPERSF